MQKLGENSEKHRFSACFLAKHTPRTQVGVVTKRFGSLNKSILLVVSLLMTGVLHVTWWAFRFWSYRGVSRLECIL